ncbi:MAG: hypothetical protein KDC80_28130, partial [Saprospiraceae bacterium]|nr:hypothetical protein [Saprospiraceae bacterium]
MKNLIIYIIAVILITPACSSDHQSELPASIDQVTEDYIEDIRQLMDVQLTSTIIIVDRSKSILNRRDREIKHLIEVAQSNLRRPGDELYIIHVYDNTANPANGYHYAINRNFPLIEDRHRKGFRQELQKFQVSLKQDIVNVVSQALRETFDIPAESPETHLLASIDRLSDFLANSETDRQYRLYVYSDMFEFSSFRKFEPTTPIKAKLLGQKDAAIIEEYFSLDKSCLNKLESIEVIIPVSDSLDSRIALSSIKPYWQEVYGHFEGPKITFAGM